MTENILRNFDDTYASEGGVEKLMKFIRTGVDLRDISAHFDLGEQRMRDIVKVLLGMSFSEWEEKHLGPVRLRSESDSPGDNNQYFQVDHGSSEKFVELSQIKLTPHQKLVLSKTDRGYLINKEVFDDNGSLYTRGLYIKDEHYLMIKKVIDGVVNGSEEIKINEKDKIIIRNSKDGKIDIRHYIATFRYTGFTRNGIRAPQKHLKDLLSNSLG